MRFFKRPAEEEFQEIVEGWPEERQKIMKVILLYSMHYKTALRWAYVENLKCVVCYSNAKVDVPIHFTIIFLKKTFVFIPRLQLSGSRRSG